MLKQIEGSHAVAEAVALSRPEVICAYPISPQTHIVEALGERVKSGSLQPCEFINVESEFAAMSVAIGSSAAGARSYTATASQGLLFMAEAVYNASMVCMDGFILTHAVERVDMPGQAEVDAFLPAYEPRQVLDPADPVSIGAMVGPEAFMEVRYIAHAKQTMALERIPQIAAEFSQRFGRDSGGLVRAYRCADADTIVVALGSVLGTLKDTVDELRRTGLRVGVLGIQSFRPFPLAAVRSALQAATRVVVLEKSFSVGLGGVVSTDVRLALSGLQLQGHTVVAGLGGRAITQDSLARMVLQAVAGELPPLSFLDLDWNIVNRHLAREAQMRRSGPIAENLLRDLGTVASKVS